MRQPTLLEAVSPIIVMLLLTSIGFAGYGLPIQPLLILAALFAAVIAIRVGVKWEDMLLGIREKIDAAMPALLILIAIGLMIGMWTISGTIPAMIFYGLKLFNPSYIIVLAFVVAAIVSIVTGSSWGSIGTVGVALMGIATGMDASLAVTAGAIVSGAYFGDKMSPLSDTTNLAPLVVGTDLYTHIKHMFYTTIPAALVALMVYFIVGLNVSGNAAGGLNEKSLSLLSGLEDLFNWSWWLILPPLIVLYGAIRRKPTLPTIIISSLIAGIVAIFVQNFSIASIFTATVSGFDVSMIEGKANIMPEVAELVNQGGMESMTGVVLIALAAFTFAGIITKAGCLEVIVKTLLKMVKRTGDLILTTVLSSITTALITANTYLPLIIPGELYKDTFKQKNLHVKNLSRTMEDSGTVVIPLVPWSTSGIFIAETLNVPTLTYLPWAVLCYTGFIFAIIWGYTGFGIAKADDTE